MMEWETDQFVAADKRFVWHPFTDMRDGALRSMSRWFWSKAWGALLRDSRGREYIDGSSSIWTNIHGHNHPHISAAIRRQLGRVAHTSLLGFTNLVAIECGSHRCEGRGRRDRAPHPRRGRDAPLAAWHVRAVREWCSMTESLLIVDEVMKGFSLNGADVWE